MRICTQLREGTKLKKKLGLRLVYSTGYSRADGRWEGMSGSGDDDKVPSEASSGKDLLLVGLLFEPGLWGRRNLGKIG